MISLLAIWRIARVPFIGPRLLIRMHRRGFGFDAVSWAEFADRVAAERPDAVTVDVFDTCIVRDLAGDTPIEEVIGRKRHLTGASVTGEIAAATEIEMCRPVDGAQSALSSIRASVGTVTFVSDTERSSALLEQILRQYGLFETGDRMVASCEEGATKSDGGLFERIWPRRPARVWHAGNNPWSDGAMAATNGFRPFEIREANLTRYEEAMSGRPTTFGPALAAASRAARLKVEREYRGGLMGERTYQLQLMGTQVAGPVMAAFTLWVADRCREHDIEHLAFLARDGELPMLVAEAMSPDHLAGAERSYLHCNRLVVTLASACAVGVARWLKDGTAAEDAFLDVNRHVVPFSSLLGRIGFAANDVVDVLGAGHPLTALRPDEPLPVRAVDEWHEMLFDARVAEVITERSTVRRDLLVDHVRSQGVGRGRLALVDVGWRGRLAWLLSSVLRDYLEHEPLHFHFGGDKVIPGIEQGVRIERFAFDGLNVPTPLVGPVSTVETITASGRPRVVDYRRTASGSVELIFDKTSDAAQHDHRAEVWRGAIRMAAMVPPRATLVDRGLASSPLSHEVRSVLGLWWNKPSRAEAAALAPLNFEHDEAGTALRPVVAPYHLSDMRSDRRVRQWIQGSLAVSSLPARLGVRLVHAIRYLHDRLPFSSSST